MRGVARFVFVVGTAALLTSPLLAQQRQSGGRGFMGGGMPPWMLLGQKSVQDELKVTDHQIKKTEELSEKQREAFLSLRDLEPEERTKKMQEATQANEKALAEILKPAQLKRLKQISLQLAAVRAFINPEVNKELKLTDAQKEKIKEIWQQTMDQKGDILQNIHDRAELRKKREEVDKSAVEKVVSEFNPEQKAKWKDLIGEPFTGEITFGGPRGGGRPSR
jgi:Spy/CpxP family protein refolding chaperone